LLDEYNMDKVEMN